MRWIKLLKNSEKKFMNYVYDFWEDEATLREKAIKATLNKASKFTVLH